uniref:Uncharacterized protein n=1 Tax=Anguilla anguilla TaxID=7936 RepID=A0A0E9XFB9_ANGAN
MLFIISENRSKLDSSSSESSSQSFQLLKSTLSQLSFALSFVNLGHDFPDSDFRKQHKTDRSVRLCLDTFGSMTSKRSISF